MGPQAPSTFTVKEELVFLRGMLPELDYTNSETEVRTVIAATVLNGSEKSIGLYDFEFLEATGKHLCVPAHTTDLEWTGRAVKELAGSGCVYVRLLHDEQGDSDSVESVGSCDSPELKIVKIETPGTYILH